MTIHVSKDAENAINAAVAGGKFTSADEMIERLVREYAQRAAVTQQPLANDSDTNHDPLLGIWKDSADEIDEIVADAYRRRKEEPWRDIDL